MLLVHRSCRVGLTCPLRSHASPSPGAAPHLSGRRFVDIRAPAVPRSCLRSRSCERIPPRCGFPGRPAHRPRAPTARESTLASALLLPSRNRSSCLRFHSATLSICFLRSARGDTFASPYCRCTAGAVSRQSPASARQSPRPLPLSSWYQTYETPVFHTSGVAARPTRFSFRYRCNSTGSADSRNARTRSRNRTVRESPSAESAGTPLFETISARCFFPSRTASLSKAPAGAARNSAPCSSCRWWFACPAWPRECAFRKLAAIARVVPFPRRCSDSAHLAKSPGRSSLKTGAFPRRPLASPCFPRRTPVHFASGAFPAAIR